MATKQSGLSRMEQQARNLRPPRITVRPVGTQRTERCEVCGLISNLAGNKLAALNVQWYSGTRALRVVMCPECARDLHKALHVAEQM